MTPKGIGGLNVRHQTFNLRWISQISKGSLSLYGASILKPSIIMTKHTIQWEGWGEFKDFKDFMDFCLYSNTINYRILWVTTDCPIIAFLN